LGFLCHNGAGKGFTGRGDGGSSSQVGSLLLGEFKVLIRRSRFYFAGMRSLFTKLLSGIN
jgi:hypothetical protein